jgi:uncharacterized protein YceK
MTQRITLFLFVAVLFSGCATMQQNQWLANHQANLKRYAESNLSAEQKMDGMIQDFVLFMKEDLKFIDPTKGVKYVMKYHDQNAGSMDKILKDTENWQGKLSLTDRLGVGLRVIQKPYLKDLIDLGPKFKRKYKEYAIAAKLTGKMTGSLTKLAGKELGL